LAMEMMETRSLDQVWFCPAQMSPHKLDEIPLEVKHRLEMLNLAICDIPQFSILDLEINRPGPSYTIETIEQIFEQEKKNPLPKQFYLIIGDDAIPTFYRWHRVKELVKLIPLLVGTRTFTCPPEDIPGGQEIANAIFSGLTPTKMFDVSSTDIRDRVKKGLYCGHLLPQKVLDYIYSNDLYLDFVL
jgi:nicotinate-nucleotide adenylyltransferase